MFSVRNRLVQRKPKLGSYIRVEVRRIYLQALARVGNQHQRRHTQTSPLMLIIIASRPMQKWKGEPRLGERL